MSYNVGRKATYLLADYSASNFKQKSPNQVAACGRFLLLIFLE